MEDIVIVSAARTAVGKFGGSLAKVSAPELGSIAIREAIARAGLGMDQIGEVIMGQVLAAGAGQNPARQAMMKAGVAKETPALTINAVCGSGLKAVMLAAQAVAWGDSDIVVAGGQENMSASPHVLMGSRDGQRMGNWNMVDTMIVDGLWDVYNQYHMGITAENVAKAHNISRDMQDALALGCQQKASAAQDVLANSKMKLWTCSFHNAKAMRWCSIPTNSSTRKPMPKLWQVCAQPLTKQVL